DCPDTVREKLGAKGPILLATGGGGGDAFPLLSNLIEAVSHLPNSSTLMLTGPLMGESDRKELESRVNGKGNIKIEDYVQDLRPYMKAADLVVSMCGYNIAAEIVYHEAKAVVVPRTWRFGEHKKRKQTTEEKEQVLRAQVLAKCGLVRFVEPDELTPEHLAREITEALSLSYPVPNVTKIQVEGLRHAVQHIREMVS
ncbi:MAG: glycosyltransferase, partial [Waddliaceae bacterium]